MCYFGGARAKVEGYSLRFWPYRMAKRISEGIMPALARAISKRRWELAALCLVLGFLEAVSKLPADAIVGMFDVLDGGEDGSEE